MGSVFSELYGDFHYGNIQDMSWEFSLKKKNEFEIIVKIKA